MNKVGHVACKQCIGFCHITEKKAKPIMKESYHEKVLQAEHVAKHNLITHWITPESRRQTCEIQQLLD